MATTINRQRILSHLLDSPLGEVAEAESLPVLEQFIFALVRENATDEEARQARMAPHVASVFADGLYELVETIES